VGKRTRVTLDTNILVSALGWRGNPHRILQKVVEGEIELFLSREQFQELARVLDYPKFDFSEEEKERFKALISAIATFVEPKRGLDIIKGDPSDNRILECALVAEVDFVISGDEHLLSLGKVRKIEIVKANEFLKES
jgi:uncharacterized protein